MIPRKNHPKRRKRFFQAIRSVKNDPLIDLVVLSIHWGIDYLGWIFRSQKILAHEILEAEADIVLRHHSHALQPMKKYITADARETFFICSLGNFITGSPGIRS